MRWKDLLISQDTAAAIVALITIWCTLDWNLRTDFCKDVYGMGITVLSIVFSIYAAAFALLMTSSDDDFARFLDEEGDFKALTASFKIVLLSLFLALGYAMCLYVASSYCFRKPL